MTAQRIVFVTGLSGAGKSTAARALEDLQYWCVDNLPVSLLEKLLQLTAVSGGALPRLALVCDLRDTALVDAFPDAQRAARAPDRRVDLLFLEAREDVLLHRFRRTGRRHPLAQPGRDGAQSAVDAAAVRAALAEERARLAPLRSRATEVVDTSDLTVHELRRQVARRFGGGGEQRLEVELLTFSYPPGPPPEVDLALDARFAPSPGTTAPDQHPGIDRLVELLSFLFPLYQREGKTYLTLGVGSGERRGRAAALVLALQRRLAPLGIASRQREAARVPIASSRRFGDDHLPER